jgi:hypothetical protein
MRLSAMVASRTVKIPRQTLQGVSRWIKNRRRGAPPPDPEALKFEFFSSGTNYYVAARWAALAGLMPVYGNLFHHAVEMYLKGALIEKGFTVAQLTRLGHNLRRLWKQFKKHYEDGTLPHFDKLVRGLDMFETIRYPDKIKGMTMGISIGAGEQTKVWTKKPLPHYEVNLAGMDQLVRAIVEKTGVNPHALMHRLLNQQARGTLLQDNPEGGFWV